MGVWICLRDDDGRFMLAKTHWRDTILLVKEGEAYALLIAIQWIRELGLHSVIFETDCEL